MSGAYSPSFATLAAKNILGWTDKVVSDSSHTLKQIDPKELDDIYATKQVESAAMNALRGK